MLYCSRCISRESISTCHPSNPSFSSASLAIFFLRLAGVLVNKWYGESCGRRADRARVGLPWQASRPGHVTWGGESGPRYGVWDLVLRSTWGFRYARKIPQTELLLYGRTQKGFVYQSRSRAGLFALLGLICVRRCFPCRCCWLRSPRLVHFFLLFIYLKGVARGAYLPYFACGWVHVRNITWVSRWYFGWIFS